MKTYITTTRAIDTNALNATEIFQLIGGGYRPTSAERLYLMTTPTYRNDGSMEKKQNWNVTLMAHKRWGRVDSSDIKVTVTERFNAVGTKLYTVCFEAKF